MAPPGGVGEKGGAQKPPPQTLRCIFVQSVKTDVVLKDQAFTGLARSQTLLHCAFCPGPPDLTLIFFGVLYLFSFF